MGRIKSLAIRRAASDLLATVEGFSEDFDKNKKLLKDTMPSKSVRNKVAGQLAKLSKMKQAKKHEREPTELRSDEDQQQQF